MALKLEKYWCHNQIRSKTTCIIDFNKNILSTLKRTGQMKVPSRFELESLDSKSRVLTITPWDRARKVISSKQILLRWLPRVSTKVTLPTGKSYKRNASSVMVILRSLFLRFASKITNIITLIFQFLLLKQRSLSWQRNV